MIEEKKEKDRVNLSEDIPGCEDNYYRFVISAWRISKGWFELGITLGLIATTFLGAFGTLGSLSPLAQTIIGIILTVIGSLTTSFRILKSHATNAILERKLNLQEIILAHQNI